MKEKHEFRIVITPFCNYRCFFCHSEGVIEECTPLLLTPQDYGFIAKAGKKLWGWDTITITGGEPLVSPIYREACELIAKEGVRITTVTNASLVSSPKKIFAYNSQVNIFLHTMDPVIYEKITGSSYPLDRVIDTVIAIRSYFPNMILHLNYMVIRGMNDDPLEMEKVIRFASRVDGEAKFIDLASTNKKIVVPYEEIEKNLLLLGFEKTKSDNWQSFFSRADEKAIITRCGFSEQNSNRGYRNLFLNPDGTISNGSGSDLRTNLLLEIHERNIEGFAKKIEWYFPPAKRI